MDVAEAFAAAFNTRNPASVAACLDPDATARVEGAPFPEEKGRDAVRDTSIAYLLGDENPLSAITVGHPEASVLLLDEQNRADVAIRFEVGDGVVQSLVYYTMPHSPDVLTRVAEASGYPVAPA